MAAPHILHASAVAVDGRAALITGASGSGKSTLALEMISRGALLVADDRVVLTAGPKGIDLTAPDSIRGLIEARGLGILRAEVCAKAYLCCVVDLDKAEPERLPPERHTRLLGQTVPLLHNAARASFPAALMQYLRCGRSDR